MATAKQGLLTADDLLHLDSQGVKGELIRGALHETVSAGGIHTEIAGALILALGTYVRPRRLGRVGGTDGGVLLERNPDTVREPDVFYISAEKLPLDVRVRGYYEVVPDLVAEIMSPSDTLAEFNGKIQMWLDFGVGLVLAVFPETRTAAVHRPNRPAANLGYGDTLDGGDVLPGFSCPLKDIFDL